jgi:transcriptional antiterminator RfaH
MKNHVTTERPWFLVQTKPNAEAVAFRNLENQNITAFMPLHKTTRRKPSKFQTILRPLFPGYIFISLELNSVLWRKIKSTRGVTRVVRFGREPSQVPSEIIKELFAYCDTDGVFQREEKFVIGNNIQIKKGPLAGAIGSIIDIDPKKRVQILFDFMGQTSKLTIDASVLNPIN